MGGTSQSIQIYSIDEDNVFLKIVRETDSYGDNEQVKSIMFVTPTEKTITTYEAI